MLIQKTRLNVLIVEVRYCSSNLILHIFACFSLFVISLDFFRIFYRLPKTIRVITEKHDDTDSSWLPSARRLAPRFKILVSTNLLHGSECVKKFSNC